MKRIILLIIALVLSLIIVFGQRKQEIGNSQRHAEEKESPAISE